MPIGVEMQGREGAALKDGKALLTAANCLHPDLPSTATGHFPAGRFGQDSFGRRVEGSHSEFVPYPRRRPEILPRQRGSGPEKLTLCEKRGILPPNLPPPFAIFR